MSFRVSSDGIARISDHAWQVLLVPLAEGGVHPSLRRSGSNPHVRALMREPQNLQGLRSWWISRQIRTDWRQVSDEALMQEIFQSIDTGVIHVAVLSETRTQASDSTPPAAVPPTQKGTSGVDIDAAATYLDAHVSAAKWGTGNCASYVENAINASGGRLTGVLYAKDFGPQLIAAGYIAVPVSQNYSSDPKQWKKGDVVVIQPYPPNVAGHMTMFDGKQWASDFIQNDMWGGPAARRVKPSYAVFRP